MFAIFNTSVPDRNFYYLSGIEEPCRGVVVYGDEPVVLASPLEASIAEDYVETHIYRNTEEFWKFFEDLTGNRVGLNLARIPVETFRRVDKRVETYDCGPELREKRAIKSMDELQKLKKAGEIAASVMEDIRGFIRPGLSEADVKAELEHMALNNGATGIAFDTIVASGPRSAIPHATASDRKIRDGEVVLVDFGPSYKMYASDISRTFCLGRCDAFERTYAKVNDALSRAEEASSEGVKASELQKIAENVTGKIPHLLGHGIGLDEHEEPNFSSSILKDGMVFTLEPGVYGKFGIRIENSFNLKSGPNNLTRCPRGLDFALI